MNKVKIYALGFFIVGMAATVTAEQLVKRLTHGNVAFALLAGIVSGGAVYAMWRWMRGAAD
jgi:hypothetical protein